MIVRILFLLAFTTPFMVFPQVPNSIRGVVADQSGQPLPGVDVTLEQTNTEIRRSYTTKMEGIYHFDCIPEGRYSLTFRMAGFITERMEDFTYNPPQSLELNRELVLDFSFWEEIVIPSKEPGEPLIISVKNSQSSDSLGKAQIIISDANGILDKSPTTNLCGLADILLEPGKRYSVRVSKDGFEDKVINFDMPDEEKRLDMRLDPIQ